MQGQEEEGIQQIQQGLAALRAKGMELRRPYHLALLAEAYGKTGQVEEGLTALAEALAVVDKNGGAVVRGGAVSAQGSAYASEASLEQVSDKSQRVKTSPKTPAPSP